MHVEHNYATIGIVIDSVTKATELFLPGSIPDVKFDESTVGAEDEGLDFYANSGDVLLLELSVGEYIFEGGFSHPAVSDQEDLDLVRVLRRLSLCVLLRGVGGGESNEIDFPW